MFAQRIERLIAHLETALRVNPDGVAELLPTIIRNLRSEVAALSAAEEEAFRLHLAKLHEDGEAAMLDEKNPDFASA